MRVPACPVERRAGAAHGGTVRGPVRRGRPPREAMHPRANVVASVRRARSPHDRHSRTPPRLRARAARSRGGARQSAHPIP
ncbi:hypothetical protein WL40_17070 [Burkholderia ubonensis]|nr:hypothetical protein WL40_17070 [Burkholderia ubonensis]